MKKHVTRLAAIALVAAAFPFARLPQLTSTETTSLAAKFSFKKLPLPEPAGGPPGKLVRQVHPSLERISAWVSSMGAAASLADLDGGRPAERPDPRRSPNGPGHGCPGSGHRRTLQAVHPQQPVLGRPFLRPFALAPMGTLAGDFNEDGLLDVMVYFWGRTPVIYLRKAASGASKSLAVEDFLPRELIDTGERWYSNAAIQADLDGDGHVDLLVANYFQDGAQILDAKAGGTVVMHEGKSKALNGGHKHIFLWQSAARGTAPAVRYEEVKNVLSEDVGRGWTLALGAADLDGDMLPEIYIANDFGPDRLLHNRSKPGKVSFALLEGERDFTTPKSCVLGHDSFKGMGVDFGDLNGDGLPDIFVSNIATRFGLTESHFLWMSTGETAKMKDGIAPYVHGSEKLGLARSGFAWEAKLADFDNDGVLEAMQACGFIKGKINRWPELQALGTSNDHIVHNPRLWPNFRPGADLSGHDCNPFFTRGADGRYHDVAHALGMTEPMVSRGIAIADVDGDGRLDFVTANQWGPSFFFKNEAPNPGAFLGLRLTLADGTPAIGAVARVILPDGRKIAAQVDGGNGHSGRRGTDIHFGLGAVDKSRPTPVEIEWRDRQGKIQRRSWQLAPGWHAVKLTNTELAAQAAR